MPVSDSMPDDVQILHRALTTLHNPTQSYTTLHLSNCGTAMRFLTAYCAQLDGKTVILEGVERMHHRPIGQLVDALREIGADIEYLGDEGFPPLRIKGCILDKHRIVTINNPQSTQFVSALLLIGANVQTDNTSPYITLTRALIEQYALASFTEDSATSVRRSGGNKISSVENKINLDFVSEANRSPIFLERDWSSAAFWYEYVALHGGEITLPGLFRDSLQGDKVVADIFAHLGVHTTFTAEGITIASTGVANLQRSDLQGIDARSIAQRSAEEILCQDFSACPDLYPAVALTCERLGVELHATGTESLPIKESNRLLSVREHRVEADHRMAMALLVAGYAVDDIECIKKSYPEFLEQWKTIKA